MPESQRNAIGTSLQARLAALKRAAMAYPPTRRSVRPAKVDPNDTYPGDIWRTRAVSPKAEAEENFDPCWVVLLGIESVDGQKLYEAAPLFTATEWAGPGDVILPRELLGFRCAAALGQVATILPASLLACEGRLPKEWSDRLREYQRFLQSAGAKRPENLQTGLPFLDEQDPAFEFHEALVERLAYLQEPLLGWLENLEGVSEKEGERDINVPEEEEWGSLLAASTEKQERVQEYEIVGRDDLTMIVHDDGNTTRFKIFDTADKFFEGLSGARVMIGGRIVAEFTGAVAECANSVLGENFTLSDRKAEKIPIRLKTSGTS